jgi:D-sedoheptulose 7-phosphate isomerase
MFDQQKYLSDYVRVLMQLEHRSIERAVECIATAWANQRTVFLCGNGGSAASACHIAADLTKLTAPSVGPRLRAVALTESLSAISAIANDLAYEEIFAEQLRAFGQAGDVVIGLSTSGSSPNVLRAIEYANTIGAFTIGVTGRGGTKLRDAARHAIVVESTSVQHVEDATMVAGHILCLRVKAALQLLQLEAQRRHGSASGVAAAVVMPAAATPI